METKNKRGISLIVLVITIIVMIILATAIILSLNNSGIIGKANKAKNDTDIANAKEIVALAHTDWVMDEAKIREEDSEITSFSKYATKKLKEAGFKAEGEGSYEVSDNGDIYLYPVIPEGFVASDVEGENTVAGGLVIYEGTEKVSTDTDAKTTRNQFVWIPVPDMSKFQRTTTYDGTITDPGSEYTELETEGKYYDGEFKLVEISALNDLTGEYAEFAAMKASVEKYGGFYIGRFETGKEDSTPVVKQGKEVLVGFREFDTSSFKFNGHQLYTVSSYPIVQRTLYQNSKSVVPTACYGVQWDAALQFIYKTDPDYVNNSFIKGNYGSTNIATGSNELYKVCNIYDMAGNVREMTMEMGPLYDREEYWEHYRVTRGGGVPTEFAYVGRNLDPNIPEIFKLHYNVISRGSAYYLADEGYGFRITLYLK